MAAFLTSLVAALTLASAPPVRADDGTARDAAARDALVRVLVASMEVAEFDPVMLADPLDVLAAEIPRDLFELVGTHAIPESWMPDGDAAIMLDASRTRALFAALERMPIESLRAFLRGVAETESRVPFRENGVRLLRERAAREDLGLLFDVARPLEGGSDPLPRSLRKVLEDALVGLFGRDPSVASRAVGEFDRAHVALRSTLVDALARVPAAACAGALGRLLGRDPALDPHLLTALARAGERLERPADRTLVDTVRAYLTRSDSDLVLTAMRACGALEDYDAIPALIGRIDDEEPDVRRAAWRALQTITGIRIGAERRAWETWYERELEWWARRGAQLDADVRIGNEGEAADAIVAFAGTHLFRQRAAESLSSALDRPEPAVVRLACHALGQVGAKRAIPRLIGVLDRDEPDVRAAARAALVALTGLDLPPERGPWLEAAGTTLQNP